VKKKHETRIGNHGYEILQRGGNVGRWFIGRALGVAEKEQHHEEHREHAERGDAENLFDAEMAMRPGSDKGAGSAADVHHGVVDGIADGADVFLGGARGGTDDARFDERDAQRGKNQDAADKEAERHGIAKRREPGSSNRANQEIGRRQDEVGQREGAAEPEAVGSGSAENRQEPDHAAEDAGQRAGLLRGEVELFLEVEGQRSERAVVGEALEDFRDVGHPEGPLKAVADFLEPLAKAHDTSRAARRDDSRATGCGEEDSGEGGLKVPTRSGCKRRDWQA
jgi:hypothetical protein